VSHKIVCVCVCVCGNIENDIPRLVEMNLPLHQACRSIFLLVLNVIKGFGSSATVNQVNLFFLLPFITVYNATKI
jgi:hypothetical protein